MATQRRGNACALRSYAARSSWNISPSSSLRCWTPWNSVILEREGYRRLLVLKIETNISADTHTHGERERSIYLSICLSLSVSVCLCLSLFVSVCLSVYLSIYLPIYLSTYLPIYLSSCLSVYLSPYPSIHLSIYLIYPIYPIYRSIHLSIYPSIHLSLSLSLSIYLHVYVSVYLSIYRSIYLSIHTRGCKYDWAIHISQNGSYLSTVTNI